MTRRWVARPSRTMRIVTAGSGSSGSVLTNVRDEQPRDPIGKQAAREHRHETDDAFGVEGVIRQIRLRDRLEIKLLPLRFDSCRFQRRKGRRQSLLAQFTL